MPSLSAEANHLGFTKTSSYLLLWSNYLLKQLRCVIRTVARKFSIRGLCVSVVWLWLYAGGL